MSTPPTDRGRRAVLRAAALGPLALLLPAHAPYRQWVIYRRRHLLIGCDKLVPESYALAQRLVAMLEEAVPEASARVARAPHADRLASLLATDQLSLAVLTPDTARAIHDGVAPFAHYGATPLSTLWRFEGFVLSSRADFPADHGDILTDALVHHAADWPGSVPPDAVAGDSSP